MMKALCSWCDTGLFPAAVAKVFDGVMQAGGVRLVLAVDEVGPMEADLAYERSHFTFYKENNEILMQGK